MVDVRRSGALLVASLQWLATDPNDTASPISGTSTSSSTSVPQATRPVTNASTPSSTRSSGQYGQRLLQIDQGRYSRLLSSRRMPRARSTSGPTTCRGRRLVRSGSRPENASGLATSTASEQEPGTGQDQDQREDVLGARPPEQTEIVAKREQADQDQDGAGPMLTATAAIDRRWGQRAERAGRGAREPGRLGAGR